MNTLKFAFRRLFYKGEHSITRIISLVAGLAFGILLLSEVFYYLSYDSFYPDANRIYTVQESFKIDPKSNKLKNHPYISGAIAPGLKAEVPGIQAASRLNPIGKHVFYTDDLKSYKAEFSLADEHLFEVLPRPMVKGNAEEIFKGFNAEVLGWDGHEKDIVTKKLKMDSGSSFHFVRNVEVDPK